MKTKLSILGGIIVSVGLLYLAFRNIDFRSLGAIYASVNDLYIIPFALVAVVEMFFRALRWKILLSPVSKASLADTFRLQAAGLALNNILPLRLGELARAAFGARVFGMPLLGVLATIVVERALDTLLLFFLFMIAVRFGGLSSGIAAYDGLFWTVLAGLGTGLVFLIFMDDIIHRSRCTPLLCKFPAIRKALINVSMGVQALRRWDTALLALGAGIMQWMMDAINYWLMARAFGISEQINIFKGMALVFAGAMAASVPGMPGYFGNFELVLKKVLVSWGVSGEVAFAYATYTHVLGYLIMTSIGLVFVYQMGHSLGRVWREFKDAR